MAAGLPKTNMTRWQATACVLILLLTAICSGAFASSATATVSVEVSWTVLPYLSLCVKGQESGEATVTSHYDLRQPSEADLSRGYIEERDALSLAAASNVSWAVKVHALESDMGTSDDGTYTKPLADFSLRANGGPYRSVSGFDQTLASGDAGAHDLVVDYKIDTDKETHKDGDYGLTLVYTITSS